MSTLISYNKRPLLIISAIPEHFLYRHGGRSEPDEAMQKWKNFNTYLALMAVHPKAQTIPVLANMIRLGFRAVDGFG